MARTQRQAIAEIRRDAQRRGKGVTIAIHDEACEVWRDGECDCTVRYQHVRAPRRGGQP